MDLFCASSAAGGVEYGAGVCRFYTFCTVPNPWETIHKLQFEVLGRHEPISTGVSYRLSETNGSLGQFDDDTLTVAYDCGWRERVLQF